MSAAAEVLVFVGLEGWLLLEESLSRAKGLAQLELACCPVPSSDLWYATMSVPAPLLLLKLLCRNEDVVGSVASHGF